MKPFLQFNNKYRRCRYNTTCSLRYKYLFIEELNDLNCYCKNYTPVEIDPYWKDIIDETNRRLNNV